MEKQSIKEVLLNGDVEDIIELLINDVDMMSLYVQGHTDALHKMIIENYPHYVKSLLDNGYDVHCYDFNYLLTSLLIVNPQNKNFNMFEILLPHMNKKDFAKEDSFTVSPWTYSFTKGYLKPVNKMINAGMDFNHLNSFGCSGLYYYFRNNNISDNFLKLIIKNKDRINWLNKDNFGISLLDILNSAKHSYDWIAIKNHQLLLKELGIKYESK